MKGLLLKDFYMTTKYCRAFLLIIVVSLAASFFDHESFFIIYPIIIASMVPVTLVSYDEREKWTVYSGTLPYTKTQIVSSKYLLGLLVNLLVFLAAAAVQAFCMFSTVSFVMADYLSILVLMIILGLIGPAVVMPFIFRFGAEKGRIVYFAVIAALCALSTLAVGSDVPFPIQLSSEWGMTLMMFAAVLIYVISWLLSIVFYKNREIA